MNLIMIISVILGMSMQQISQKAYSQKKSGGAFSFPALSALCAAVFFVAVSGGKLSFDAKLVPYSLAFAVAYAASIAGLFLAIKHGSLSLSSLLTSYSLVIPTFYGIVALNETINAFLIIGIALLLVSFALVNGGEKDVKGKISLKWLLFVLLSFAGNGLCTVIQKIQQQNFSGAYKSEFMIAALIVVAVVLGISALLFEKREDGKGGSPWIWCVICGLCNGAVNLFVMILTNRMNVSVMFPLISAGGIIVTFIVSQCVYKEKLSLKQKLGTLLGILAVVALNI